MNAEQLRVSIIIPVLNGAATLRDAIDSVLSQRAGNLEVILVDDGSTDSTPAIITSYGERVRALHQPNRGPAAARNAGATVARGEYLAFLDADDKWLCGTLEHTVAVLDEDPVCVLVYGNLAVVDSAGCDLDMALVSGEYAHAPSMNEMLTRMWPIMPSAALMRRAAFINCGGFPEEFRNAGYEDAFLWLRLRELGPFRYLPQTLAAWRFSSFPRQLKMRPFGIDRETFARLVRQRYGIDPTPLVNARLRATRSILGYIGLMALRRGDRLAARLALAEALRLDPYRVRNQLRFLKTFLPLALARALSGRTAKAENGRARALVRTGTGGSQL